MNLSDFDYHLPLELVAQFPLEKRADSRLLYIASGGTLTDYLFPQIIQFMSAGDVLVLNDTKVIPARVYGHKESGGKIELLLERVLDSKRFNCQIKASRSAKIGTRIRLNGSRSSLWVNVIDRLESLFQCQTESEENVIDWFEQNAFMPLPPYIERAAQALDADRYQTVYSKTLGAVAAPTAGLHYDGALIAAIEARGVKVVRVTLHVGTGTYQPVRNDDVTLHTMHSERIAVSQQTCDVINQAKQNGNAIIAAGTTVLRTLEAAASYCSYSDSQPVIQPFTGETDIFITPGFQFKVVDKLQTNFHQPKSTLMMLVSAFCGLDNIKRAYQYAIEQRYRFLSYGDTMLIERN